MTMRVLRQMAQSESDMTTVCTTLVTDMSELFAGEYTKIRPPVLE